VLRSIKQATNRSSPPTFHAVNINKSKKRRYLIGRHNAQPVADLVLFHKLLRKVFEVALRKDVAIGSNRDLVVCAPAYNHEVAELSGPPIDFNAIVQEFFLMHQMDIKQIAWGEGAHKMSRTSMDVINAWIRLELDEHNILIHQSLTAQKLRTKPAASKILSCAGPEQSMTYF
jgi:hypothetical protein